MWNKKTKKKKCIMCHSSSANKNSSRKRQHLATFQKMCHSSKSQQQRNETNAKLCACIIAYINNKIKEFCNL